ncbi:MAG: class I SAM-dependent methyltransferase [Thermodesulfobacteriota bacterium]|nr:class I SAM-dependent methyltransferase [Thermodesulfobacteriota bacterium]
MKELRENPIGRFSLRVQYYLKYRPKYPDKVISYLRQRLNLTQSAVVADIGSGTGLLSEMFLKNGNFVCAVEPNNKMREASKRLLEKYERLSLLKATAEDTRLESKSVDFVVAGQAFHWFNADASKREFSRIIKPGGFVVLIWNVRSADATAFLKDYEELLCHYAFDYQYEKCNDPSISRIKAFFYPYKYTLKTFENRQSVDYQGLLGRLLSSSYAPLPDNEQYQPMIHRLKEIFETHNKQGVVSFEYVTKVYSGRIV